MSYKINKKKIKEFIRYALQTGFDDEESAQEQLHYLIKLFNRLPDPIMLYRLVYLNSIDDLNRNEPGTHYVLNKQKLIREHYDKMLYDYSQFENSKPFIISVLASKNKIDFDETINHNLAYPHESEITLKEKGKGVNIINIEKLKQ
jgi:hypothetical protein